MVHVAHDGDDGWAWGHSMLCVKRTQKKEIVWCGYGVAEAGLAMVHDHGSGWGPQLALGEARTHKQKEHGCGRGASIYSACSKHSSTCTHTRTHIHIH